MSLSYFLEFRLWRLAPAGYHAANLPYHLLATLAVTWRRGCCSRARAPPCCPARCSPRTRSTQSPSRSSPGARTCSPARSSSAPLRFSFALGFVSAGLDREPRALSARPSSARRRRSPSRDPDRVRAQRRRRASPPVAPAELAPADPPARRARLALPGDGRRLSGLRLLVLGAILAVASIGRGSRASGDPR